MILYFFVLVIRILVPTNRKALAMTYTYDFLDDSYICLQAMQLLLPGQALLKGKYATVYM